jgi:hemoglobin/transferrin/lactoferrin receptor protein
MNHFKLLTLAIATALGTQAALADEALQNSAEENAVTEKSEEISLDMVSVVGQATSGVDSVVTQEMLENAQASDLNDVFALNPEVSAGGGVALGQKIYVRNIGEDLVNVTVDGASQAGGVFHHAGRVVIEPDLLKQVEVEAGAGSATAGLGALGGSVRFVTKDPEDLLRGDETVGATIKSTYYSNGESFKHSATVYASDEKGKFSGLANIVSADLNNREDGGGDEITGSESENFVGFVKLVANINDEQKLSLSYESLNQEGEILYKPEYVPHVKNLVEKTEANRETIIANYNLNTSSDLVNLSVNAYHTQVEQLREDQYLAEGDVYDGSVESFGLTIENTSILGSNKLIYGANYREDTSKLEGYTNYNATLGYYDTPTSTDESGEVLGFYVQDIISVTDQLTVTTGLRYDDYSLKDVNGQKITNSGIAPNLSANYAITPELSISGGYAEAIRGATVRDAYTVYEGGSTNDPDLKAERSKNTEIAIEYNVGSVSLAGGAYKSIIDDAIGYEGQYRWSSEWVNTDDIETNGYYLKAGYEMEGLSVNSSFHSAKTEQGGVIVERYISAGTATSIGDTFLLDVNYQIDPSWLIGWTGQVVSPIASTSYDLIWASGGVEYPETITTKKEGYSTHDIYVRWSPMADDTIVLNLTVKNVFDEDYINHSSPADFTANAGYELISGQNDPGRDIRLRAAFKF